MGKEYGKNAVRKALKGLWVLLLMVVLGAAPQRETQAKAAKAVSGYRIYAENDMIKVMEAVDVYWEENGDFPACLIAEYEGNPVYKLDMEGIEKTRKTEENEKTKETEGNEKMQEAGEAGKAGKTEETGTKKPDGRLRLAFDREGRWVLYFLIKEEGVIKSGRDRAGRLEFLVTKEDSQGKTGQDFLEWKHKMTDYGGNMYYFSWEGELLDGVEVSVGKRENGEYRQIGSLEGEGFWLKVKGRKYIKLCPFVLINGNKHYGQGKVLEVAAPAIKSRSI